MLGVFYLSIFLVIQLVWLITSTIGLAHFLNHWKKGERDFFNIFLVLTYFADIVLSLALFASHYFFVQGDAAAALFSWRLVLSFGALALTGLLLALIARSGREKFEAFPTQYFNYMFIFALPPASYIVFAIILFWKLPFALSLNQFLLLPSGHRFLAISLLPIFILTYLLAIIWGFRWEKGKPRFLVILAGLFGLFSGLAFIFFNQTFSPLVFLSAWFLIFLSHTLFCLIFVAENHGFKKTIHVISSFFMKKLIFLCIFIFLIFLLVFVAIFSLKTVSNFANVHEIFFGMVLLGAIIFWMIFAVSHSFSRRVEILKEAAQAIESGHETKIFLSGHDELTRLGESFNSMAQSLDKKENDLSDFISMVGHELKTPMNNFRWSLETLQGEETGPLNKNQKELVSGMHGSALKLIEFVEDFLNITHLAEKRFEIQPKAIFMETEIKSVFKEFESTAHGKGLTLEFKQSEKSMPQVLADSKRLHQILVNLLGNAIKFTEKGGVKILLSRLDKRGPDDILAKYGYEQKTGAYILVSVSDSGWGIPFLEQKKIFDKFFRASNVDRKGSQGTGLGLYITKNLIDRHGGAIWFESEEGEGTTFFFTLPIKT